ncbi:TOPRIM nucleotidyl transferase/hydrolase domain-containing protein [Streptomyces sp. NPDC057616]|uniref:TOPRIM nucleotidyl transferase/hydrolase domain-containing protein n=1 Tax=Streptomyces sp. NPDC057616 TaxID=3346183 RepID=UPI003691A423
MTDSGRPCGVGTGVGSTEFSPLGAWWESSSSPPSSANIALIDVGGDKAFGRRIEFLQALDFPWAVITDGPALHPTCGPNEQRTTQGLLSAAEPDSAQPVFDGWNAFRKADGVINVAYVLGNYGAEAEEFEAYLKRL